MNADEWPDDATVPSFGPRMRCSRCGKLGASAVPNWIERADTGHTAAVTNVERGRSIPLYEFFKSGVQLWDRQGQRAVDAAGREALTNPDMARTMSSALGRKQPAPMQIGRRMRIC